MNREELMIEKRKLDAEIRMLDVKVYTNDERVEHFKALKEKETQREEIYKLLRIVK